jgi:hypothetical protein
MSDQPAVDLASLVATLLQQQTAMLQQQTALLQVHGESIRLQRLLVERFIGNVPASGISGPARDPKPAAADAVLSTVAPPPPQPVAVAPAPPVAPMVSVQQSESSNDVADRPVPRPTSTPGSPDSPVVDDEPARGIDVLVGEEGNAAHASRYYRAPPAACLAPVQPQDLELLRRLREMRDASGLILQFGPHKGETMGQVAVSDPDYIRQLIFRAQRPEVRAAACRIVEALDAAAEHRRRAARSSRRSRASA